MSYRRRCCLPTAAADDVSGVFVEVSTTEAPDFAVEQGRPQDRCRISHLPTNSKSAPPLFAPSDFEAAFKIGSIADFWTPSGAVRAQVLRSFAAPSCAGAPAPPEGMLTKAFDVYTPDGWRPWCPGAPIRPEAGLVVDFERDGRSMAATFESASEGVQLDLASGDEVRVRKAVPEDTVRAGLRDAQRQLQEVRWQLQQKQQQLREANERIRLLEQGGASPSDDGIPEDSMCMAERGALGDL